VISLTGKEGAGNALSFLSSARLIQRYVADGCEHASTCGMILSLQAYFCCTNYLNIIYFCQGPCHLFTDRLGDGPRGGETPIHDVDSTALAMVNICFGMSECLTRI
jgi:hypothetical protein